MLESPQIRKRTRCWSWQTSYVHESNNGSLRSTPILYRHNLLQPALSRGDVPRGRPPIFDYDWLALICVGDAVLGLTDTTKAIENLPGIGGPANEASKVTGTTNATPADTCRLAPQQYPQQLGRKTVRTGAATCDGGGAVMVRCIKSTSVRPSWSTSCD